MNRTILAAGFALFAISTAMPLTTPALAQENTVDLQALEKQVQKVLPKIRSCTVGVGGGGSGVVVSKDGLILSCAHVTQRAGRRVVITFPDGRRARATSLGHFHTGDASLLRLDQEGDYPFADMAKSDDVSRGDWVLAVGYPVSFQKNKPPPVRIGRVIRSARNALISDAPIMGGDSGGPLFNLQGKVIGISSRVSQNIASNVHVPIDLYHQNWERLLKSEEWGQGPGSGAGRRQQRPDRERQGRPRPERPSPESSGNRQGNNGRSEQQASSPTFKSLGVELQQTAKGVMVKSITVGSLAHRSGVRAGHLIRKIGKTEVKDMAGCEAAIKAVADNDKVMVMVTRQDADHAKVTLGLMMKEKVTP